MNNHIVGSILSDLQTTFESIYNVSEPVAGGSNQTTTDCLSVKTSGLYQSTVDRTYTVTISTGGAPGTAQCTIVDSIGTDPVALPQTIDNDVAIGLGALGATIEFNLQGTDVFVVGDLWVVTCKHDYYTNVKSVIQAQGAPQHLDTLPGIAFAFGGIKYSDDGSSDMYHCDVVVPVELWISEQTGQNIQTKLLYALKDIEHAVQSDPSRGGVAIDSFLLDAEPFLPVPGQPFAAISVSLGIRFKNTID